MWQYLSRSHSETIQTLAPDPAVIPICANGSLLWDGPGGDELKRGVVVAACCRRWNCETCGPIKGQELRSRLSAALTAYYEDEVAWLRQSKRTPLPAMLFVPHAHGRRGGGISREERYRVRPGA
jgi:hypothetical protein